MKYILDEFCTISDMAKILKINKHTLLYYEKENIIEPKFRGANGYRYYSGEQLAKIKTVLYLRELGFSIIEIKEYLNKPNYSEAIKKMEKKLFENSKEIEMLIKKREQLEKGIVSLKNLKSIESKKGSPFLIYEKENKGSYLQQTSFELKETVINMKKIDDLINEVIWTEKYKFGLIISKENVLVKNFKPSKFFVSTEIKELKKYELNESFYAILYTDNDEDYSKSIETLLKWIEKNNYIVTGDLYIEDPSTYCFSEKYNPYVKIFKIAVKKN